jgi:type III pantothenate kinase
MARRSDYLLIDVSNSFAKLAFASRERVSDPARIPTAELSSSVVAEFLRRRQVKKLVVSSVVPTRNSSISKAAHNKAQVLWLDWKLKLGVTIDYPKPESIGADRLANAAAVAELYGWPAIVVDFGTAVTFDVVSDGGSYIGGVIAPGLEAMTDFLYQRTALLPRLSLKEPHCAVGKSTVEAMRSGAIFGYRGLVREILARIKAEQFSRKRLPLSRRAVMRALLPASCRRSRCPAASDSRRIADRGELELISQIMERPLSKPSFPAKCFSEPSRKSSRRTQFRLVRDANQGLNRGFMRIWKIAAIAALGLTAFAADNVAPTKAELEEMYNSAYRAFDARQISRGAKTTRRH